MKTNLNYQLKENGFTLMGVVVSLLMVTIVGAVLAQFSADASDVFMNVERNSLIADTYENLRPLLSNKAACTYSFQNQPVQTSRTQPGLLALNSDSAGNYAGVAYEDHKVYLKVGETFRGITVKNMHLIEKMQVTRDTHLVDLVTEFETKGRSTQTYLRSFPLVVVTQAGKVKECWAKKVAGKSAYGSVCAGVSGMPTPSDIVNKNITVGSVFDGLDANTNQCGYASGQWIAGNESSASCPGGSLPPGANDHDNCALYLPPNFKDPLPTVTVNFSGGGSQPLGRAPAILKLDKANLTCNCYWGTDIPASSRAGAKCLIYCAIY